MHGFHCTYVSTIGVEMTSLEEYYVECCPCRREVVACVTGTEDRPKCGEM